MNLPLETMVLVAGIGGTGGVVSAALALGVRHGIDWDHIAAITDITSTTASAHHPAVEEGWLTGEVGVLLTDETHHAIGREHEHEDEIEEAVQLVAVGASSAVGGLPEGSGAPTPRTGPVSRASFFIEQRAALFLGSMYALGHGTIVTILGLIAILGSEFLPEEIDPIMERVVGITLIFLAAYLFYSVWQFFRGGEEFHLRSRWMLVFAGVRNGLHWLTDRFHGEHEHMHAQPIQQYGVTTAYGVGLIHGIGAETGTQVLVIATAVGASTQLMGIAALLSFVIGLIISNSVVTVVTTAGFISSQRRQWIYVGAGLIAAIFSLALGLLFVFQAGDILPDLGRYFRWIGGPGD